MKRELARRNLPDLFMLTDGKKIGDRVDWEQIMRPYWKQMLFEHVFGNVPPYVNCLIALSAPRAVFVGGALEDQWADNDSQFLACAAASPVWELYGKKGLLDPDRFPQCGENFNDGSIGFHLRAGEHFHSRYDWNIYMQSVRKYFD